MGLNSSISALAERIARDVYGLTGVAIHPLAGEKDATLRVVAAEGAYVLKLTEPLPTRDVAAARALIDLQDAALAHVGAHAPGVAVQRVVPARDGSAVIDVEGDGGRRLGRLLTFLPGRLWARCNPRTPDMRHALGRALAEVDVALQTFSHPAAERDLKWDLSRANWIRGRLHHVADPRRRDLVARQLDEYERLVQPRIGALRHQVIYNDANDHNVVLVDAAGAAGRKPRIGLIDFGDVMRGPLVCDLAIACAYAALDMPDPLSAAAEVVEGFHRALSLTEAEIELLFPLIATRLCVSVVNAAWQGTLDPRDDYAQISARPAWAALEAIEHIHPRLAGYTLRAACGLSPVPHGPAVTRWLHERADDIGRVVEPDLRTCPKIYADWSAGSLELGSPDEFGDAAALTRKLWARMAEAEVQVAIGGAGHARPAYGGAAFRAASNDGVEWRTVHLGLDVFMDAGSPVFAPLDGVVHSVACNDAKYDYGRCVVLQHTIRGATDTRADALTFYTLYGHLTPDSLDGLHEGKPIARGEAFARIGTYPSNGDWPPHLHLQIILDMLDRRGDFDGSCRPSQRKVWLSLCADPNLIARIPERELRPQGGPAQAWSGGDGELATAALLDARRRRIGRNLSVSYRKKLHIVRGWMQWLYDAEGQRYLDCVNNVAHVGHCHPHVVRAGQAQMAVLNTNTRYLHENLVEYARRLTEALPEPLRVCYFVNSGSEANELALRLARAHTRQKDMIVVDVGYHGNTTSIVDISPYKHAHAGGMGAPNWVHVAPIPDPYRGSFGAGDPRAGEKYAAPIAGLIARAAALPQHVQAPGAHVTWRPERGVAGFICESVLSCGGQIVLPDGYLAEAYRLVRAAGGVCIADEVQTGFGRAGSHFWAFELQGVTPDIVTLGKPMGNGHPLGAVVTTPEIAASFDNGLEYFNTFGGNPVSCAIGLAVLDVIAREGLQARAQRVGAYLRAGLRRLMDAHEIIGDVRGVGLFDGFELVRDRASKAPATAEASALVNRMRDHGILLSTDGPFENVIKIKPPLCFGEEDVELMLAALDQVLREDAIRVGEA